MSLQFRKAERKKAKLRIGLSAPSGGGKTYSALKLAHGMVNDWSKIAIIDTENGSGELYSHLGGYNVVPLTAPFTPEVYIEAIKMCENAGMEVVIIDSISHEWDGKGGCLESNELLGQTKFKGNNWAAWSVTTPRHQKFIDALTTSTCHIITAARSKTDTIQTEDKKIKKVGLKDIQREGFEYELTVAFNLDREGHYATASKDRTELFIARDPFVITEETGKQLIEWANNGKEDPAIEKHTTAQLTEIKALITRLETNPDVVIAWILKVKKLDRIEQLTIAGADEIINILAKRVEEKEENERQIAEITALENQKPEEPNAEQELDAFLGTEPSVDPLAEPEKPKPKCSTCENEREVGKPQCYRCWSTKVPLPTMDTKFTPKTSGMAIAKAAMNNVINK